MVKINDPTENQRMRYLNDLYKAFIKVDISYYSSNYLRMGNNVTKSAKQYAERVFAYELYHQFRCIIEAKHAMYSNLVLNGEIPKTGFEETQLQQSRIDPDLVLHKGQNDCSPENQKLFIEIKTSVNPDLKKDIAKLKVAVSDRLNYQFGIMICINANLDLVKEQVRKYCKRQPNSILDKLYLIHPDSPEPTSFSSINIR